MLSHSNVMISMTYWMPACLAAGQPGSWEIAQRGHPASDHDILEEMRIVETRLDPGNNLANWHRGKGGLPTTKIPTQIQCWDVLGQGSE